MEDEWTRDPADGSYVNAAGWKIRISGQHCYQIKRPNGFRADNTAYPTLELAKDRVAVYACEDVA